MIDLRISQALWLGLALTFPFYSFEYFRIQSPGLGEIAVPMIFMFLVFGWEFMALLGGRKKFPNVFFEVGYLLSGLFFLFLGWHVISIILLNGEFEALVDVLKMVIGFASMVGFVVFFPKDQKFLERFWMVAIWSSALVISIFIYRYAIVFKAAFLGINWDIVTRVGRNQLTWYLDFIMPFALCFFWGARNKLFAAVPALILVVALLYAGSRGALLSVLCGLLYILFIKGYREGLKSFGKIPLMLAGAVFVVGSAFWGMTLVVDDPESIKRFSTLNPGKLSEMKDEDRWGILNQGLENFYSSPMFGIGFGKSKTFNRSDPRSTHNDYLKIIAELGIVGLVLFFAILGTLLARILPTKLDASGSIPWVFLGANGCVLAGTISLFLINGYQSTMFWMFMGLALVGKDIENGYGVAEELMPTDELSTYPNGLKSENEI